MARLLVPEKANINHRSIQILFVILVIDFVFLVIHATHVRYDVPNSGLWLISRDRGFPELFQYVKEATIIALTLMLFRVRGSVVYLAWAVAFLYLLLDDSMEIHETVGEWLAEWFGFGTTLGVEARDLGQVLVSATAGTVLLGFAAVATLRDRSSARDLSLQLGVIIVALAFFGVVTDVIDAIDFFGVVEDGGEMAAMSVAVGATVHHYRSTGGRTPSNPAG